ncbi:UDP-N-acetylmuramoyl-L-alanine--D-glutamate ligase [Candidatus Phycosocius spiralis]|uniref:UDP-N-acetylmuramoylalanine--D-glutamate ligase n=1 Tax=Candidatus Phycosocius spiralis TaxID=2815099 RepID=A0ABQ4PTD5_9PROT|nr:UDP-N-acetylmuramoyl-L-alanine--D-glutamate ligase [Candidatus Phycosocius spiralis]GIU66253.1 UDP-N-acetylmuramoylalanine--D-glutamate ligase [Candidatus Phycosocius spiralis]
MIPVTTLKGQKVAVFGLARTGIAAALALEAGGACVLAWDESEQSRTIALEAGLTLTNLSQHSFDDVAALVMSPGVPIYGPNQHWIVPKAQASGVAVIGDVELFAREINAMPEALRPFIIAITGTNGKSTTTALISHILASSGKNVRMGGNIGTSVLALEPPRPDAIYVLELSSYQLDLVESLRVNAAVHLNLTPDHLERHATMERYAAAKQRIFANQKPSDWAILGVDDDWGMALCTRLHAAGGRTIVPISASQALGKGVCALGSILWDNLAGRSHMAVDLTHAPALPGVHNAQNAAAAYAAARAAGLSVEAIAKGIKSFAGLEHRLQEIASFGAVRFYNDSKATNADATAQALAAFSSVRWIVGGQAKLGGIESLRPLFGHVKKAYLFGEAAAQFAQTLEGEVSYEMCETIDIATKCAWQDASQTDTEEMIILSPACASFDQFPDFEARGRYFTACVKELLNQGVSNEEEPAILTA